MGAELFPQATERPFGNRNRKVALMFLQPWPFGIALTRVLHRLGMGLKDPLWDFGWMSVAKCSELTQ